MPKDDVKSRRPRRRVMYRSKSGRRTETPPSVGGSASARPRTSVQLDAGDCRGDAPIRPSTPQRLWPVLASRHDRDCPGVSLLPSADGRFENRRGRRRDGETEAGGQGPPGWHFGEHGSRRKLGGNGNAGNERRGASQVRGDSGVAASAGKSDKSVKKLIKKKTKSTAFRRLRYPKPTRLLFQTPTPEEEREKISGASWHKVDATDLEMLTCECPVHVISDPKNIGQAVKDIRSSESPFLGIDCEWKPVFRKTDEVCKIDVLQLASQEGAFVFHITSLLRDIPPCRMGEVFSPLHDLMADPSFIKGGQTPLEEMKRLEYTLGWPEGTVKSVLCTKYLSSMFHPSHSGLDALAALFLDRRMEKPKKVQMSNWSKVPLTEGQILYAAMDAVASRDVMMAMLLAVRENEGLSTLLDVLGRTRPMIDSTIPDEFMVDSQRGSCLSCKNVASELLRKFGRHWGVHVLFERCLRDACGENTGVIPPVSSFLPRQVSIYRPGVDLFGGVHLPNRKRDVLFALPGSHKGKPPKAKALYYLAVEKALHQTGLCRDVCDLRLHELVSRDGPRAVSEAVSSSGYRITVERSERGHVATCVKVGSDSGRGKISIENGAAPIVFTLDSAIEKDAFVIFQLMLIQKLGLKSAS